MTWMHYRQSRHWCSSSRFSASSSPAEALAPSRPWVDIFKILLFWFWHFTFNVSPFPGWQQEQGQSVPAKEDQGQDLRRRCDGPSGDGDDGGDDYGDGDGDDDGDDGGDDDGDDGGDDDDDDAGDDDGDDDDDDYDDDDDDDDDDDGDDGDGDDGDDGANGET